MPPGFFSYAFFRNEGCYGKEERCGLRDGRSGCDLLRRRLSALRLSAVRRIGAEHPVRRGQRERMGAYQDLFGGLYRVVAAAAVLAESAFQAVCRGEMHRAVHADGADHRRFLRLHRFDRAQRRMGGYPVLSAVGGGSTGDDVFSGDRRQPAGGAFFAGADAHHAVLSDVLFVHDLPAEGGIVSRSGRRRVRRHGNY